jgi:ribosome biogenesis GTPase
VTADLLSALGWDAGWHAEWDAADRATAGLLPARITRVDRSGLDLLGARGPVRATASGSVLAAMAADTRCAPAVGDWAMLRHWPDERTTIEDLLPRRTSIVRATAGRQSQGQVLAANHDVAMVVEGLHPEPDLARMERLLTLAWQSDAQPVVVLTKADLVPDADDIAADVAAAAPGVAVHVVSSQRGTGLPEVAEYLEAGRTVAMLGPSGAGKSSLTNALAGAEIMATRRLRADGKGRHTTAHRQLVLLPGGGVVIDTPGLRSVGLFAAAGMERVFDDLESLAGQCRFHNCSHRSEPGCAVTGAITTGDLDPRRLESWRKLQAEMHRAALRQDARLRAAESAAWRRISRTARAGRPRGPRP